MHDPVRLYGEFAHAVLLRRSTRISTPRTKRMEVAKTTLPAAFVFGESPLRSMLQISIGSVTSKRVSRKEIINSSQEKVSDKNKLANMAGQSKGAVIRMRTCQSRAPRSRAARSMFIWGAPIWL